MLVLSHAHAAPAARVFDHVWRGGAVMREELAEVAGLSAATVSRAVRALTDEGLIRQRRDIGRIGSTGRPSIPLGLDTTRHAVVGVHAGRVLTTIAVADLRGRVVAAVDIPTPVDVASLPHLVATALAGLDGGSRMLVSGAIVSPWTDLGIDRARLTEQLSCALGVQVVAADHVTAAATAEHSADARAADGVTAYVYARDTIGFAVVEQTPVGTVVTRSSRLTHLPIGSTQLCSCLATGCLGATASDRAIALRAVGEGLLAEADVAGLHKLADAGSARAIDLLHDRATTLGRAAAFVRDMVDCDRVVLMGQAFTSHAAARNVVLDAFEQSTTLGPTSVDFGHHGPRLQAVGACTVALVPVREDPLRCVDQARPSALISR